MLMPILLLRFFVANVVLVLQWKIQNALQSSHPIRISINSGDQSTQTRTLTRTGKLRLKYDFKMLCVSVYDTLGWDAERVSILYISFIIPQIQLIRSQCFCSSLYLCWNPFVFFCHHTMCLLYTLLVLKKKSVL